MTEHEISMDRIDEHGGPDVAFAAFCECGWRGDWHHADTMATWPEDPEISAGLAEDLAQFAGDAHLDEAADEDDPAPDTGGFRALSIPATGPGGYAR